jgi:hypothetical protein
MGQVEPPSPALLLLAAFSRYETALAWARRRAEAAWGPVATASEVLEFSDTDYYEPTMGRGLQKVFLLFAAPFDPGNLAEVKLQTNQWEAQYATAHDHPEPRPLNLDPGYLTLGKLVLASTKDHAHRVYLGRGVYAEVTLYYKHRRWQAREWTYPDYRREDYQRFFSACRERLRGLQPEETSR